MKIIDWPINFGTMLVLNWKSPTGENAKMVKNYEKSTRPLKTSIFCAALNPSLAIFLLVQSSPFGQVFIIFKFILS